MGSLNDITKILANEFIQGIFIKDTVKLAELNSLMHLFITWNIPFQINFSERTRSDSASIILRIQLSPTSIIEHLISLEGGSFDLGDDN